LYDRSPNQTAFFRYDGRSMWPCFQRGDLLVVRRVPAGRLRRGDCIVYRKREGEAFIVHRIISLRPAIRTQGDARPVPDDQPVSPAWLLGRVIARIRFGHRTGVSAGFRGRCARQFFRYAGRVDPSRDALGGRVARAVQRLGSTFGGTLAREVESARVCEGQSLPARRLTVAGRTVGVWDDATCEWLMSWPFMLLLPTRSGVHRPLPGRIGNRPRNRRDATIAERT
jgi:hypothetical protein